MNKKQLNLLIIGISIIILIPILINMWSLGIGAILGVIAFMAIIIGGVIFGSKAMMNFAKPKTIENGVPATATVVSCQQGNSKISLGVQEIYQLIIQVNVTNTQGETWAATMKEMIPLTQIAVFQPGVSFAALYDPNDKTKVVIDQNAGNSQAPTRNNSIDIAGYGTVNSQMAQEAKKTAPQDITLRVIEQSKLMNELTASGIATTATVISNELVFPDYMKGADVYELKVMVNATNRPAFPADVTFLIGKSSLFKIEPGKNIFVKYDFNDATRVCITGLDKENSAVEL